MGLFPPVAALVGGNTFAGDQHLANDLYLDNVAGGLRLTNAPTTAICRALQVIPVDNTKGSGLVLAPGRGMSQAAITTQVLMYGALDAGGTNYDRFGVSNVGGQMVIDSTFGGTGTARRILFQMGGSAATAATTTIGAGGVTLPQASIQVVSTAGFLAAGTITIVDTNGAETINYTSVDATHFLGCTGGTGNLVVGQVVAQQIHGQNALVIYPDASVDLNGGAKTIDGVAFGATHARIADPMETGGTVLIIDTRTVSGTNNAADSAVVQYSRGGSRKWQVGLNWNGDNVDTLDFYTYAGGVNGVALQLTKARSAFIGVPAPGLTATDGFPYIPADAGTPTGVPTAKAGMAAVKYDTTAHKLWIYDAGWKGVVVA